MTDTSNSDETTSTDAETHNFKPVDQDLIFELTNTAVYELSLECKNGGCTEETIKYGATGDPPRTSEDVEDLIYELYHWFYDNSGEVSSSVDDQSIYLATFALIPGDKKNADLTRIRCSLFTAAHIGYVAGKNNQSKIEREELISTVTMRSRIAFSMIEEMDPELFREFLTDSIE